MPKAEVVDPSPPIKEEVVDDFFSEVENKSPPPYRRGLAKKSNFIVKLKQGLSKTPLSMQEPESWWEECLVGAGYYPILSYCMRLSFFFLVQNGTFSYLYCAIII